MRAGRAATPVTIDGVMFTVNEGMLLLRASSSLPRAPWESSSALYARPARHPPGGCLLSTILGVVPALHYIFGKRLSPRSAGIFIPLVMKGVDVQYGRVRAEFTYALCGGVLDVGCGGGAYQVCVRDDGAPCDRSGRAGAERALPH